LETDRPNDCFYTDIVLVTDSSGDTVYSGTTFTEAGGVLTIDTSAVFFGSVFLKEETYVSTVFNVDKVVVTVCGD